nr:MAG TPA: hypothetical protein [Caudoviricetes sp.]
MTCHDPFTRHGGLCFFPLCFFWLLYNSWHWRC